MEDMLAIVMDPDFQALVAGEDEVCDQSTATLNAGWEEVYVDEGKVVNVVDGESQYESFAVNSKIGSEGKTTSAPSDINL